MNDTIFTETQLGSMKLQNRVLRTACGDSHGVNGHLTDEDIKLYDELADGGIGALITGYTYVSNYGMSEDIGMFGICDDSFITDYQRLTAAVHKKNANIILQLVHLGSGTLMKDVPIYAPSVVENAMTHTIPEAEMSVEDIIRIEDEFVNAAVRAQKSGFDGIELHAAHGFLINQFLSPHYNKRTDIYGGSVENRSRFAVEIITKLREALGGDYPILVKVMSEEIFEDGITPSEFITQCKLLEAAGASAIEVSGPWMTYKQKEPYFLEHARALAEQITIPVILTGGVRNIQTAEDILDNTQIKYIGLCRPFINNPLLLNKWKSGERSDSACVSCGACSRTHRCILRK